MAKFDISISKTGYSMTIGAFALTATGVIRDRSSIRATVSVSNGTQEIIFRDNVNLTGERSRRRVQRMLEDKGCELAVSIPSCLLALDKAIRNTPTESANGSKNFLYEAPSDVSGKVTSLAELKATFAKWLLMKDPHLIEVVLGAVVAHRLGDESPWMLLVSPPSGVKTELLRALWRTPGVYPLSDLTARTFASGLESGGRETSLLARLNEEILVLKDMTTVLELYREERQAILAQLREIYDGRYDKTWGTGKELHWEGRLGFLTGVTPVIDQHHSVMAILGPRFLQLRLLQPDRQEVAKKAMGNSGKQAEMRQELAEAVASFLGRIAAKPSALPVGDVARLAVVADLATNARSAVVRDGYKQELSYAPEPEGTPRMARQLYALAQGIVLVTGVDSPTTRELNIVIRVAKDCIPKVRQVAIKALLERPEGVKTSEVAKTAQYSSTTMRRALEDLQALGLVWCEKGGMGVPDVWGLDKKGVEGFTEIFSTEKELEDTALESSAPFSLYDTSSSFSGEVADKLEV
jgi:hypothetical protein